MQPGLGLSIANQAVTAKSHREEPKPSRCMTRCLDLSRWALSALQQNTLRVLMFWTEIETYYQIDQHMCSPITEKSSSVWVPHSSHRVSLYAKDTLVDIDYLLYSRYPRPMSGRFCNATQMTGHQIAVAKRPVTNWGIFRIIFRLCNARS